MKRIIQHDPYNIQTNDPSPSYPIGTYKQKTHLAMRISLGLEHTYLPILSAAEIWFLPSNLKIQDIGDRIRQEHVSAKTNYAQYVRSPEKIRSISISHSSSPSGVVMCPALTICVSLDGSVVWMSGNILGRCVVFDVVWVVLALRISLRCARYFFLQLAV